MKNNVILYHNSHELSKNYKNYIKIIKFKYWLISLNYLMKLILYLQVKDVVNRGNAKI